MNQEELFYKWYSTYRRKKSKAQALTYWRNLSRTEQLDCIKRTNLFFKEHDDMILKGKKMYIPHASTWINQRRWEDEAEGEEDTFLLENIPEDHLLEMWKKADYFTTWFKDIAKLTNTDYSEIKKDPRLNELRQKFES